MPEHIKLPFLETKISLFDLQNLEKKGFFRSVFIELLKADKIKNIIPNELQINQTKQELFLNYNLEQLKNKKDNEFLFHNLKKEICKLASLKKLALDKYSSQAVKIFESLDGLFTFQLICGSNIILAPLAPPLLSEPLKVEAEAQAVDTRSGIDIFDLIILFFKSLISLDFNLYLGLSIGSCQINCSFGTSLPR